MALVQSKMKKVQIAMSVPSPRPTPARGTPEGAPPLHGDPSAVPLAGEGDHVSRARHLG